MDYLVYPTVEACTTADGDINVHVGEGTTTKITNETLAVLSGYQNGWLINVIPVKIPGFLFCRQNNLSLYEKF